MLLSSRRVTGVAITATAGLLVGGLAYAALYPQSQIFGRVLIAGDDPKELALTFDDGPNPKVTPHLLEVLAAHNVRATFFLIGAFVQQQRVLARQIASAGHVIGNHTTTHPRLAWQTARRIRDEIAKTNSILEDALGIPVSFFRPPHGARRPYVLQVASELGLTTVQWNVTASDWNPVGAKRIAENIERGVRRNQGEARGSNILLHDGSHHGIGADRFESLAATSSFLGQHTSDRFVTVDLWDQAS